MVRRVKRKITEEILNKMIEMRKRGAIYSEIMSELSVSKWACMQYLKDIKYDRSAIEIAWRKAEKEAAQVLKDNRFSHIVDLNKICPSPYCDYYAEKDGKKYLIDVTINQSKNLVRKASYSVDGYKHIVLLKNGGWKFMEIYVEEMK